MDSVTPANSTKYFSGRGSAAGDSLEIKAGGAPAALALDQESLADQLDLSKGTREVLDDLKRRVEKAKIDHPQHAQHLPELGDSVRLMGQVHSFLRSPHTQQLAKLNPSFRAFYQKIEGIGGHLQQVMARMREEARAGSGSTYHNLV